MSQHSNLAEAENLFRIALQNRRAGLIEQARTTCERVLTFHPGHAGSLRMLAEFAMQSGSHALAEGLLQTALIGDRRDVDTLCALARVRASLGRTEESFQLLDEAVEISPQRCDLHVTRGQILKASGRRDEAGAAFENAASCLRDTANVERITNELIELGRPHAGIGPLIELLEEERSSTHLRLYLGRLYLAMKNYQEAKRHLQIAIGQMIDDEKHAAQFYHALGLCCTQVGDNKNAEIHFRRALNLDPAFADAHVALSELVPIGAAGSVAHRKAVLALNPDRFAVASGLLRAMCFDTQDKKQTAVAMRQFSERFEHGHATRGAHLGEFSPHRMLQVGFVSSRFANAALASTLCSLLAHRPDRMWTAHLFAAGPVSTELHKLAEQETSLTVTEIAGKSTEEAARTISSHHIDILVDLDGHGANNRLDIFIEKPAPLNVAWLGDALRGLACFDYLICDPRLVSGDEQDLVQASLVALPPACPHLPVEDGETHTTVLPAVRNGYLTFGTTAPLDYVTPETASLWSCVLQADQGAKLLWNNITFRESGARARIETLFGDAGISASQVELCDIGDADKLNALLTQVDLLLDCVPVSYGAGVWEGLRMGIPTLTLGSNSFAGRHAASVLQANDLSDFVVNDKEQFVEQCRALRDEKGRLSTLRADLPARISGAAQDTSSQFAEAFTKALQEIWRHKCLEYSDPFGR